MKVTECYPCGEIQPDHSGPRDYKARFTVVIEGGARLETWFSWLGDTCPAGASAVAMAQRELEKSLQSEGWEIRQAPAL